MHCRLLVYWFGNGSGLEGSIAAEPGSSLKHLCNAPCKVAMPTISSAPGDAEDALIRTVTSPSRRPTGPNASGTRSRAREHGQSIAEFALVVPILLVLFVAIADFGRVFAAGVAVEAATRNAAEATANEYLSNPPGPLDAPAPGGNQAYYDNLHAYGGNVVCAELRSLPNTTCPSMPVVIVCIHDGADNGCGAPAQPGGGGIPANCGDFTPPPSSSQGGTGQRWVEVRTCYQFTNILQMPLFSFGDIWLQRSRNFTIPCYFVLGYDECG
jgi:TadE-like protein